MLGRNDRDRLLGDVDAERRAASRRCSGNAPSDELRLAVRDVEVDVIEADALDLMVDRAGDDVARRELAALVVVGHEPLAAA